MSNSAHEATVSNQVLVYDPSVDQVNVLLDGLSPEVRGRKQILANGLNWSTNITGVGPDYPYVRNWPMESGAMFTEQDVKSLGKVCVIGKTVADQMFPNEDPIGQTLRIRNLPFRILGVLSPKGFSIFGSDEDDVVLIPYTSHMRRVSRRTSISMIRIQAADADKVAMDASPLPELAEKLVAVFESQIAGGKRYDLAAMGRRVANATFFASHATDTTNAISFAMDLTPLVQDDALSVADFTLRHIENLRADVAGRLGKMT